MTSERLGSSSIFFRNLKLEIVERLRDLVLQVLPASGEKLSWNVPFYKMHATVCFIWPSSVLWGKTKIHEGVRLGFNKGYLMENADGYLEQGGRKQVFVRDIERLDQIDEVQILALLHEAVLIDEELAREKRTKKGKK
ncbi:MAG: DUF1801 domain-containing protein [Saprospiraceae bacterium]